jgi:hypothetical protein
MSLSLYFLLLKSEKINAVMLSLIESGYAWGFSYWLLFNLLKGFLLLFGIVGLFFFLFKMFIAKEE